VIGQVHFSVGEVIVEGSAMGRTWPKSVCPADILDRIQATQDVAHVTCPDCIMRLLAQLQNQQSVLMRTLASFLAVKVGA